MSLFSLPPEWAHQSGVMLTWPHEQNSWYPSLMEVEENFIGIATEIAKQEKVLICCLNTGHLGHVKALLQRVGIDLTQFIFKIAPSNDVWARDHGPITLVNGDKIKLLNFKFNGWGNKYPAALDDLITKNLYQQGTFARAPLESIEYVLEGGSIEVDGEGTLLTTRSCLLSTNRNSELEHTVEKLEENLREWLGIQRILWLDDGYLAGDDTDGHIDTLARFTNPDTIAYVVCDDRDDEHFASLQKMEQQLRQFKNYQGKPYHLIPLPWPGAKYGPDNRRLPATYANFLIINDAVLMPTYADSADEAAIAALQQGFPNRKVIGVPCRHIIEQYGSLHCVSMQLPFGVL